MLARHAWVCLGHLQALASLLVYFLESLPHLGRVSMGHVSNGQQSAGDRKGQGHSHRLDLVHFHMTVKSGRALSIRWHLKRPSHRVIRLSLAQPLGGCAVFLQNDLHLFL
jgi:hypothetical protein